ncbi:extracellular solute-binding protein [Paenibacillus qinlingensis]|uniref:extracellular solute-binding protein n=1 Tax=Paenibacillus qinlingensis TaxID=1837343 RepID=UPI0015632D79|nr:extracellular solute-binding protein [Paenibacillus qinlingensis]NQX64236.1 extracellular solute-binding protein [Paenibacillus qinlingensis]
MILGKRKRLAVLLAVSMLVSLNTACRESTDKLAVSETVNAKESVYPPSLTYWVAMDTDAAVTIKSNGEMGLYKQLEKMTGTKVEFYHPPAGETQTQDQFNMMMAAGKLPDVISTNWLSNSPDKAIKDGKILRLNEIIDQYAPNLSKLLHDKPYLKKEITTDEGNIYAFPYIADDPPIFAYHGLMLRKDWLDVLHLQLPSTIDEWEKVLTAFRDGDPNKNGKKDEIPFYYRKTDMENSYPFIGAFGITPGFFQDGGVVKYGPAEPQFKDFLTLMNKWYKAGLIDRDYLTSDNKIRDGKMLDNQLGSMAGWVGSNLGTYMQIMKDKEPQFKLVGVSFPTLKVGGKALSKDVPLITGHGAAISTAAKNPKQIAAWLDFGYSKEGSILYNFGVEGESYTLINGKPQYTDLILKNPKNLSVSQALSMYSLQTSSGPFASDPVADKQWHADAEQAEAMNKWIQADHSKELPNIWMNAEEQQKYASIMSDLTTYKNDMVDKFIMGVEPLVQFEQYLHTLTKLKMEDAIKLNQAAYDRYLKK